VSDRNGLPRLGRARRLVLPKADCGGRPVMADSSHDAQQRDAAEALAHRVVGERQRLELSTIP